MQDSFKGNILKSNLRITVVFCTQLDIEEKTKWSAPFCRPIKLQNYFKGNIFRSSTWIILTFCIEFDWKLIRQKNEIMSFLHLECPIFVQHSLLKRVYQVSWLCNYFCYFSRLGSLVAVFLSVHLGWAYKKNRPGRMLLKAQKRKKNATESLPLDGN